ncbi:MAG: hypothetical protein ABJD68_14130 [Nakamurella sp.]
MTARLHRIHTFLRESNVPSALGSRPGLGQVLQAGVPDSETWDVLVVEAGAELVVQGTRGVTRLPPSTTDAMVADTVKLHVVHAWADQGNPEAKALLANLGRTARLREEPETTLVEAQSLFLDGLALLNPLHVAGLMVAAANELGSLFLSPQPMMVDFALWSPWGTIRGRYARP